MRRKRILIAAAAAVVAAAALLVAGGGWISSLSYRRAGDRLAGRLPETLAAKYGGELRYTLDKFWSCYRSGICSRNDMTDVMDRMRALSSEAEITDRQIFEFIGFVSRLYTDRFEERHLRQMEEELGGG
ncbi:MAG: hypothetical protein PHQ19_03240 [Candidatus Krumholzibacteria bacterium]|nr:hypothetical protein [Candidatus Krumholzibacteria bacterium]